MKCFLYILPLLLSACKTGSEDPRTLQHSCNLPQASYAEWRRDSLAGTKEAQKKGKLQRKKPQVKNKAN